MRDIRVGVVGRISAGDEAGRYVEVLDDSASSGGFLIQMYERSDRSGEGHDAWVGSIVDVDFYFDEAGWSVEWLS